MSSLNDRSRGRLRSPTYDVIVVGGRVAGAMTALHLARAGHRVLIVDRSGPPTDTVSTHGLTRTGVLQLKRAGILDDLVSTGTPPIKEVRLVFGDESHTFPVSEAFGVDAYYAPRRTVLDSLLLSLAVEAGAEYRSGVSVSDLVRDDSGRVAGVGTKGGRHRFLARQVVGADGTYSRIARLTRAGLLAYDPPANQVVYGYFQGIASGRYDFRFVDGYNTGLIPTNDGLTLAFLGGRSLGADPALHLVETLHRIAPDLAEQIDGAKRVGAFRQRRGTPTVLRQAAGPGWALVGDAGFTENPISAHGMSNALRDAELCAEAIDRSLSEPKSEMSSKRVYQAIRDGFARPLLETSQRLARFDWDGPTASLLLKTYGEVIDRECEFLVGRSLVSSH